MNRWITFIRRSAGVLLLLAASLSLGGCGGAAAGLLAGGGIGGTGFSTGAIVLFGSVVVNGVEFQTNDNTIRRLLDDSADNITGLADNEVFRVGMVVRVRHAVGDNLALQIDFLDDLEGPVADLDAAGRTFTVLGQPVAFAPGTNFVVEPGATFDNEAIVAVSGLYDDDGTLHATYIKVEPPENKNVFEIKGTISGLTGTAPDQSFTLNRATIQTNANTALKNVTALADGLYVEVKTSSTSGTLVADSVEGRNSIEDDAPAEGEASVEGYVAGLRGDENTGFDFTLNGIPVHVAPGTTGIGAVAPNARIEAEGTVSNGVLAAEKIDPG